MYENFSGNKISRNVLISEIDDLLVDLIDLGFEWYFPNPNWHSYSEVDICILKAGNYDTSFKLDDTMIDCISTLSDWMSEKYGISSVSYKLSLVTGKDIVIKEFSEDDFGLSVFEIVIILNL